MDVTGRPLNSPAPEPGSPDLLDSWKQIATYLRRDVRTVQRWEQREGLPVHRHVHTSGSSVYAVKPEIDDWWRNHRGQLEQAGRQDVPLPAGGHRRRRLVVAVAVVGIGLACGSAVWLARAPLSGWLGSMGPALEQVAVLSQPFAVASPDGGLLAYKDGPSTGIWLRDLRAQNSRLLVAGDTDSMFAWSRDGRRIGYTVTLNETSQEVRTVDVRTGATDTAWRGSPDANVTIHDWSVDGSHLLCTVDRGGNVREIALLSRATGGLAPIVRVTAQSNWPHLSPDGRFVAYASSIRNNWDIYLAAVTGGREPIRLTDGPERDWIPFWEPDGDAIVFVSARGGSPALWSQHIDPRAGSLAGAPVLLHTLSGYSFPRSLDARGQLLFSSRRRDSRVMVMDVDAASGVPRQSPSLELEDNTLDPAWSGDGRALHFRKVTPDGSYPSAFERDMATGDERLIRFPSGYIVNFLARAPDGRSIAFYGADGQGMRGVFVFRPDSRGVTVLWKSPGLQNPPLSWSGDGRELLFSSSPDSEGRLAVMVLDVTSRAVRTVARSWVRPFPQWSPDGQAIAYTDEHCLMVVPRAGGDPRQVACAPPVETPPTEYRGIGGVSWSPDGRKLAWTVDNSGSRRGELWIVDMATGRHDTWAGEQGDNWWPTDPAWSPDGRRMAVVMAYRPEYELWLLRRFLR